MMEPQSNQQTDVDIYRQVSSQLARYEGWVQETKAERARRATLAEKEAPGRFIAYVKDLQDTALPRENRTFVEGYRESMELALEMLKEKNGETGNRTY